MMRNTTLEIYPVTASMDRTTLHYIRFNNPQNRKPVHRFILPYVYQIDVQKGINGLFEVSLDDEHEPPVRGFSLDSLRRLDTRTITLPTTVAEYFWGKIKEGEKSALGGYARELLVAAEIPIQSLR